MQPDAGARFTLDRPVLDHPGATYIGTVCPVAGLFISESIPYTASAYLALPAITLLHSRTQLYPGAGRKSDQLETRERGHAAVENSEDSARAGRIILAVFSRLPESRSTVPEQYRQPGTLAGGKHRGDG